MTRQNLVRRLPRIAGTILLAVMLLANLQASGTAPRITSLGGAGDYLEDDANVLRWFGSLGDYPGTLTADFGHFNIYYGYHDDASRKISGPSLGVHHDLGGRLGTVAGYLHSVGSDALPGSLDRDDLEKTYTLIYSRLLGPAQIGLMYRQGSGENGGNPSPTRTSDRRDFGLGLRMDLAAGAYLDLAGEMRWSSEEFLAAGDPDSPLSQKLDSESGLGIRSRLFLQLGERTALVPLVEYTTEDRPVQPQNAGYFPNIDGHLLRLGCGLQFFPDTDHFLYAAAELNNGSTRYSYWGYFEAVLEPWTHQWNTYSLLVGWESRFQPWMTLRSSFGYRLARGDGSPPDLLYNDPGLDFDDLYYTLGAGFHLGGFDLDAALTEQEPLPFTGDWGLPYRSYRTTYLSVALRWMY